MDSIRDNYRKLTKTFINKGISVSCMESCTGGLIASLITDTEGASEIFRGSFVTYTNSVKVACGVPLNIIREYGVYSAETASHMAIACRKSLAAELGIGVTGTFSNTDPNNSDSVPGLVYFAISFNDDMYNFKVEIPELETRLDYKMKVAEAICSAVLKILGIDQND